MSTRDPALDAAEAALNADRPADAIPPLLESWRARRAALTASLLEAVSLLALDLEAVPNAPVDVYSRSSYYDWAPMSLHPWSSLPPPDPRATLPLILSAKNSLHSDYKPSFPAPLAEKLRAHGDPRAIGYLEWMLARDRGSFAADIAALERTLPPYPDDFDAESLEQAKRLVAQVAGKNPLERIRAALDRPNTPQRSRVLQAFVLPGWLGRALFLVDAPKLERGTLVGCSLRPRLPWLIETVLRERAFRTVRELSFSGDSVWARAERPPWWAPSSEPWTGPRTRTAVMKLLHDLADCSLRVVRAIPPEIQIDLAYASREWPFTALSIWFPEADPDGREAFMHLLCECSAPSLTKLELLGTISSPEVITGTLRLGIGPQLRELELETPLSVWDRWIASGALPRNILSLKLGTSKWDAEISRDEDHELSRVSLKLADRWDAYEPIAEDPPTPGADLIDFLRRLPDDGLTSLFVDSLGELDEEGRASLIREARRQRWLSELLLPGEDDEPVEIDLSEGM